jgi:hypothetical protein
MVAMKTPEPDSSVMPSHPRAGALKDRDLSGLLLTVTSPPIARELARDGKVQADAPETLRCGGIGLANSSNSWPATNRSLAPPRSLASRLTGLIATLVL